MSKQITIEQIQAKIKGKTCKTCIHRERWQCNSKVIQYCGKIKSKKTQNGLKRITINFPACGYYNKMD